MVDQHLSFQVGDRVIHWSHGPGVIVQMEEKKLSGRSNQYYVVQMSNLTLWVPVTETGESCLRFLTPPGDFQKLFRILSSPGEPLSADRYERKTQLTERLKDGTLESICGVVRDLTDHNRNKKKMSDNDNAILERARRFLLDEWSLSMSIPVAQAERELETLLKANLTA